MRRKLALITFALAFLASPGLGFGATEANSSVENAIAIQERHNSWILAMPGVIGTGITLHEGRPALLIYVSSGAAVEIPTRLDGLLVVARETASISALTHREGHTGGGGGNGGGGGGGGGGIDPKKRFGRPVPIGISSSNEEDHAVVVCTGGTYGMRVKDASGSVYALSNNHVYAKENLATIGSAILQPGLADTNCSGNPADRIANLTRFVPLTSVGNEVDAAIAESTTSLIGNSTPSNGYGTPKSATAAAQLGATVQKYGRTTGYTQGTVSAVNVTISVLYLTGVRQFVGQVEIKSLKGSDFSGSGDSGSLVVNGTLNPVGLLFAGSNDGSFTYANPIDKVLQKLGVTIDGA